MSQAIKMWERAIERDGPDPERFLFLDRYHNRETAQERMRDRFDEALNNAGLALNEFGHMAGRHRHNVRNGSKADVSKLKKIDPKIDPSLHDGSPGR